MDPGLADEPYAGPPPTRRPEPGQWIAPPWQPAPWQPPPWQQATWQQPAPWQLPRAAWGPPAAPGKRWVPPGTPPHDVPQPFLHAMRSRTWAGWRPVVGLLLLTVVGVVGVILTLVLGIVGLVASEGAAFEPQGLEDIPTPGLLLLTNLATMVAIPVVWLAWVAAHGMGIGWSSSVLGRLRWRLLPAFVGHALATIGLSICLSLGLAVAGGWEVRGPVASYGWLLVVVLLTTPLQSAAEEYLFRGYLSQAIAGWIRAPLAGAVVAGLLTAVLFSLAHVPPDLPTFLQRFFVGLAASAVTWLSGGLEAAIALHAVNNVVIFVLAGALGEDVFAGSETAATAGLPWFDVVLSLLALVAFVALVARSRGRLHPETCSSAVDLRQPVPVPVATH